LAYLLEEGCEELVPPPTFTPRRFPAESEDPALNPPARFVAVRIPIGRVGLYTIFGSTDGRVMSELSNNLVGRIIIMNNVRLSRFQVPTTTSYRC
jgi:hypothetical protein